MSRIRCTWLLVCTLALLSTGCCCVQQGMNSCGGCGIGSACGVSPCGTGLCGPRRCDSGCGEKYVDEWISEPPQVDNCGYSCGGCGHCRQCQPVRNILRLLFCTPPMTSCGTACDSGGCGGCDSCGGGVPGGYVDDGYDVHHSMQPVPDHAPSIQSVPAAPSELVPTPAPQVTPTGARRLNPAMQRQAVKTAGTRR